MLTHEDKRVEHERLLKEDFVVGAVRLNEPIEEHKNDYECAAWWESRVSNTGTFKVALRRQHTFPYDFYLSAGIDAKVKDDYFPALWGGNPIGKDPYRAKHIGEERTIILTSDFVDAIEKTGQSEGKIDWYVNPQFWHIALIEAEFELKRAYRDLPKYWDEYTSGDDQYNSRVRMVRHFGSILVKRSEEISRIKSKMHYFGLDGSDISTYWTDLHNRNTKWARDFLGIV